MSCTKGSATAWVWRTAMAIVGGMTYWFSVRYALVTMGPFIGGETPERYRRGDIIPRAKVPPTRMPRSTGWIATAVGVGFGFVAILGPGIAFGKS